MKNTKSLFIAQSGLIAAVYVALTWVSGLAGLSFGSVQFRLSEVLTILPVFTPAAIPGLTIGCFIANLGSPYGIPDILFGTLATLVSSLLCYKLRDIKTRGLPIVSALMPVWANAIAVSAVICAFLAEPDKSIVAVFAISALQVGAGELATGTVLGLGLYKALEKSGFERLISQNK